MSRPAIEQAITLTLTLTPCQCGSAGVNVEIETPNSTTQRNEHISEAAARHLYAELTKLAGTATKICDEAAPQNREEEKKGRDALLNMLRGRGPGCAVPKPTAEPDPN